MNKENVVPESAEGNREKRIPRPPNAFMIFGKQHRRELARQYPEYTNKQISKILGNEWRSMDPNKKAYFHKLSEDAHEEHMKKHPGYYYSPLEARQRKAERKRKSSQKSNDKPAKGEEVIAIHSIDGSSDPAIIDAKNLVPISEEEFQMIQKQISQNEKIKRTPLGRMDPNMPNKKDLAHRCSTISRANSAISSASNLVEYREFNKNLYRKGEYILPSSTVGSEKKSYSVPSIYHVSSNDPNLGASQDLDPNMEPLLASNIEQVKAIQGLSALVDTFLPPMENPSGHYVTAVSHNLDEYSSREKGQYEVEGNLLAKRPKVIVKHEPVTDKEADDQVPFLLSSFDIIESSTCH